MNSEIIFQLSLYYGEGELGYNGEKLLPVGSKIVLEMNTLILKWVCSDTDEGAAW